MNPIHNRTCPVCGTTTERRSTTCRNCIHIEPTAAPGNWVNYAACAEVGGDVFFTEGQETILGNRNAKRICDGCPVRNACLKYSLDENIRHGVWGGLSPIERGQLKRAGAA